MVSTYNWENMKSVPVKSISIVLPTYNEKKNIEILVPEISEYLAKSRADYEIIIVDDNSPDGTSETAMELSKKNRKIRLVKNTEKKGIGFALRKGIESAKKEIILTMDADCSIKPREIGLLLAEIEKGNDFVVGSKYLIGAVYEKGNFPLFAKAIISEAGNRYISIVSGVPIRDFSLNFRAFRREVAESTKPDDNKNFFLVQQVIQAHKKGFSIKDVPVSFLERKYGESKTKIWGQSFRFFWGCLAESFLK
ncbi:Glycosyltransferase AglD [uncultured archaeon]|nr:Glycosyltransferase AglD [uncultured archaeon]